MGQQLEVRDFEILRTVGRLHLVSTPELLSAFFPSYPVGFRRLSVLANADLLRRHTKGAPSRSHSHWRLTVRGVQRLLDEFPREPLAESLDDQLKNLDLDNIEHREALTRLYLDLLRGGEAPADGSKQAVRLWSASVRARADRFFWYADRLVTLQFTNEAGETARIVPDATIESPSKGFRFFVELDRSNKTLARIRENLERYAGYCGSAYHTDYSDRLQPVVLYLVRSERRREHIAELCADVLGAACQARVLIYDRDAAPWLAAALFDETRDVPRAVESSPPQLDNGAVSAAARAFIDTTRQLLSSQEVRELLRRSNASLLTHWHASLKTLHDLVKEG